MTSLFGVYPYPGVRKEPASNLFIAVHNQAILGENDRARRSFVAALAHDPELEVDSKRVKPSTVEMFRLVKRSLRGTLSVTADREAATVVVDGKRQGSVPLELQLPIGRHDLHRKANQAARLEIRPVFCEGRGRGRRHFAGHGWIDRVLRD